VTTDRTIYKNKLRIIIHNNGKDTRLLIDAAVSGDRNVIKEKAGKVIQNLQKKYSACGM